MGVVRTFGERGFVRLAALPTISNTMARLADARLPPSVLRRLIKGYIRLYRVDMSEVAEPIESFADLQSLLHPPPPRRRAPRRRRGAE